MGNGFHSRLIHQVGLVDAVDFKVYDEACHTDPDVQRLNNILTECTRTVMRSLAQGADEGRFSFDAFKETTTALLEVDCDVMEVILELGDDVWKNADVFSLVQEFFDCSLATLEFCTATQGSISRAKSDQSLLKIAVDLMPADREPSKQEFNSICRALKRFCKGAEENPFGPAFIAKFYAVRERHESLLCRLTEKKKRLDRKLRHVKVWAKVSSILLGAALAAVLICSIVAAALAAPPVVAGALAAVASLPLGSMWGWVKTKWKDYETRTKHEQEGIIVMELNTKVVIGELDNINRSATNLEIELKAIVADINLVRGHTDIVALRIAVEDISSRMIALTTGLDDLQQHVSRTETRITRARTTVLGKIAPRADDLIS